MSKFSSSNFDAYAAALRKRESSDSYTIVNEHGYTGAYQFGKDALIDAGFMDRGGNWTSYARSHGVGSWDDFKANSTAQDVAFQNLTEQNWKYLRNHFRYVGQTIGGVPITVSGMLAGAHLVGHGAVKRFLNSGGATVPKDGNHVPVTEYMRRFAGYDFIFGNRKGFGGAYNGRLGDPPPKNLWNDSGVPGSPAAPYLNETRAAAQVLGARSWLQDGNAPNVLFPNAAIAFTVPGGKTAAPVPHLDRTISAQQIENSPLGANQPATASVGPERQNANDVVRQDFSTLHSLGRYRPSYLPPTNAASPGAPFLPTSSSTGSPLAILGATHGVGYTSGPVVPPTSFIPAAVPSISGGLPGLIAEVGLSDPRNPNAPPPGGLLGLVQEYMREKLWDSQ